MYLTSLGEDKIYGIWVPGMNLMGIPPFYTSVSTPVLVEKAGIPAPPDLIFSARVPCGQI